MKLKLHRDEDHGTRQAPAKMLTGTLYRNALLLSAAPSRMRTTNVTFTRGAHTAWHHNLVGQTLWGVYGVGRVQIEAAPLAELKPGDTAISPPNVRH